MSGIAGGSGIPYPVEPAEGEVLTYVGGFWVASPASSGVSAHDDLDVGSLAWTSSGHTGTAGRVAGFDGGGAATTYPIGSTGGVQAYDATLTSIAALGTTANRYLYTTGADTWAEGLIASVARTFLEKASASSQRTALGFLAHGLADVMVWSHGPTSSSASRSANAASFNNSGVLAAFYGTTRRYQKSTSSASTGGTQNGFAATTSMAVTTDYDFTVYKAFRMDADLSNLRQWVGMGASFTNSDTIGNNSLGIRYSNGTDTNFMLTARGAGAQATPVDTGVVVTANDECIAEFKHNKAGGTISVRISKDDGVTWSAAVSVATVPATGTNLGPAVIGWNIAGTRATSTLWSTTIARQYLEAE